MSDETIQIVDSQCAICGREVRGEMVEWGPILAGNAEGDVVERIVSTAAARHGGHVCRGCGTVLCAKEHKKEVQNVKFMKGYQESPCPSCGTPLRAGFFVLDAPESAFVTLDAQAVDPGSGSGSGSATTGQPRPVPDIGSVEWVTEEVPSDVLTFPCQACGAVHRLPAAPFKSGDPTKDVPGLTPTDQAYYRFRILPGILSAGMAILTFQVVHNAMFGPTLEPGAQLLVPAVAAVVAYNIALALFSAIPPIIAIGGIKLHLYHCDACGSQTPMGSNGSTLVIPKSDPEKGA